MLSSWVIGRVRNVPVEVHASLPLGALVVALGAASAWPDAAHELGLAPEAMRLAPLPFGFALALAFVACVALHELSHLVVAKLLRAQVRRFTLTVVGGCSRFSEVPADAWHQGLIEAAGPATSVALGLCAVAAYRFSPAHLADVRLAAFDLAQLNLVLAVLNLVPASPMDGGRVLRLLASARLGSERASRLAMFAGRGLAVALFLAGLVEGAPVLLLIAVFVLYAGSAEPAEVVAAEPGLRVGDVMVPARRPIAPEASLEVLERRLREEHQSALLVTVGERVVGVVGLTRLMDVLPEARRDARVFEIMARELPLITPGMRLEAAARHMERLRVELLPVRDGNELVGVVRRELPRLPARPRAIVHAARPEVVPAPSVRPVDS